jgi:hypothetical protein
VRGDQVGKGGRAWEREELGIIYIVILDYYTTCVGEREEGGQRRRKGIH